MKIGSVTFPNPFFMAPMAGVTDSIVRILARRYQCGMVTTEMVAAHVLAEVGPMACLGRMQYRPIEKPIAIQIFGADARTLCEAARRVEYAGADIVDINMGCSVAKIANVGGGAALCRRPADVGRLLDEVVRAVSIPVTIKIRKGWDELHTSAFDVLRVAEEAGVASVAIHARTSRQAYSGDADWDFIRAFKAAARIPVIGNGDIRSAADALRMLRDTGCDAVMIGRASRGNPWIFQECVHLFERGLLREPPSLEEKLRLILEHMDLVMQKEGDESGVVVMRKFLAWYTRGLPGSAAFRDRLFRIDDLNVMNAVVQRYFHEAQGVAA